MPYRYNGRDYNSLDDMPPEVRAMFEATPLVSGGPSALSEAPPESDGIPVTPVGSAVDAPPPAEAIRNKPGAGDAPPAGIPPEAIVLPTQYDYNGTRYASLDDMPPEVRGIFEAVKADSPLSMSTTHTSMALYRVGDKTYRSLDEMPADLRALIEKSMPSGAPAAGASEVRYRIGDKEYKSLDDMPAEFRAFFKDENKNGIPDVLEPGGGERIVEIRTDPALMPAEVRRALSGAGPGFTIHIGPGAARFLAVALVLAALLATALIVFWLRH